MKKSKLLLIASLAILSLGACKKDKDPEPTQDLAAMFPDKTVDVYLAGYETNENGIRVATYWKNGIPVALTDGIFNSNASYVFISGADIYVCGTEENQNGKTVAKYWKNGNSVNLSDGTQNASALSIAVVNNIVYVSGSDNANSEAVGYWVNGVATPLPNGSVGTEISVSGNDIYISGRYSNDTVFMGPRCWKNGQIYPLNDTSLSICLAAKAIGSDIYLAGYDDNGIPRARYWKNGTPILLDTTSSYASDIDVVGSDIYISCIKYIEQDTSTRIFQAGYWKNRVYTMLSNNAKTKSISKFNDHLYICGYVNDKGVLWIDDNVFFTTSKNAVFSDVKVTPK